MKGSNSVNFLNAGFSVEIYFLKNIFHQSILVISFIGLGLISVNPVYSQQTSQYYQPNPNGNQSTTKQEIARFDIKVIRDGNSLPISLVPRVRKGDVLQFRLLDEPIGGVKLDQTAWDWTLVVAYANPLVNQQKEQTVSQEIQFRKQGWYKQYTFIVPFDSQPVFFLSPRANFRSQIVKAMTKNFGDISKIGEKMVEISGAYAQINTFLSELQTVVNRNQYGYNSYGSYNSYNSSNPSAYGSSYNYSSPYGYGSSNGSQPNVYNQGPAWQDLAVERLAKSFNIQMPGCWYANNSSNYNSYNSNNNYSGGNTGSGYPSSYYSGGYTTPTDNSSYNSGNNGFSKNDFVARSQCLAKAVNPEDFDISVTRMWQQGGVFLVAELEKRYPQIAFYINIAAAAIDFIVRAFQKSAIRIVPTILATNSLGNSNSYQNYSATSSTSSYNSSYYQSNNYQANVTPTAASSINTVLTDSKISLYSNTPPTNQSFLTTYPIVVQKWQSEPDADVVRLNTPVLSEPCLHLGVNLLKNSNLTEDWTGDNYTRDFKLIILSDNGFRKEFPLNKNLGLGGWELNLSATDVAQIPKTAISLEAELTGMRGFNEVRSEKFKLPLTTGASKWEMVPATQQDFAVGGRHRIALRNSVGDCLCIQNVTYKPSFGGQFMFDRNGGENSLQVSSDNLSVWFEVDTSKFQSGQGTLEVKTYGGENISLPIKLYSALPVIKDVRVARGDHQILLTGERLDQLRYVMVNGYRATIQPNTFPNDKDNPSLSTKLAIFDDPRIKQTGTSVSLELGLEDDRHFSYPQKFNILLARPSISADGNNEVEGVSDVFLVIQDNLQSKNKKSIRLNSAKDDSTLGESIVSQLISNHAGIFPIETQMVSLSVQNNLSDYEFKSENISIETRIEKSQMIASDNIKTAFEVLDTKAMRVKFFLYGDTHTNFGGRRIQFRIRDHERGDSDWLTIKQTFIRLPTILSVKCLPEMNNQCEMKGDGMDYVGQVSVDGGKTWYAGEKGILQAQPTADGKSMVMIPQLINKNLLQIKLRDFPNTSGLVISNFNFVSLEKKQ